MKFNLDRFSEFGPEWTPMTFGEKNNLSSLIAILGEQHSSSLGKVVDIHKVAGLEINSSNLLLEGSVGSLVVKLLNDQESANLDYQVHIYEHIKKLGLPGPHILSCDNGELLGRPFIVMPYIPGKYFSGSKQHLDLSSNAIKEFHQGFTDNGALVFPELQVLQSNSNNILTEFLATKDGWDSKFGSDLTFMLRASIDVLIDTEAKCSARLSTLLDLEKSILHVDLHPHNIIVGANQAIIIDIDSLKSVAWPSAIGFCFYKLARQVIATQVTDKTDFSGLKDFFEIISSDYDATQSKIQLCFLGGLTEILRRIIIILEGNLNQQVSPWNSVLEIQIRSISEIHFLFGKVFSDSFKSIK